MSFRRPHTWVDVPMTRTERKRVLNVAENKHTVMIWDRKYQDIDTGKFDTNKMHTINSYTLADIFCDTHISNWPCERKGGHIPIDEEICLTKPIKAYDDIRAKKKVIAAAEIELSKQQRYDREIALNKRRRAEARIARKEAMEKRQAIWDEYQIQKARLAAEKDYEIKLINAERRAQTNLIYLGGHNHGQPVTNIRPNNIGKWGK